jgi:predicted MFS family arabinose efflux permease
MPGTWFILGITLAVQAAATIATLAVPTVAPAVAEALHVSPSLVGAYVALMYAGAIGSSVVSGPLVMRWGAIRVSQAALLVCACGMALQALSPTVALSAASALLTGMGYGQITPAASHLLARTTPAHRMALVFSVRQTGVPVGGVIAGSLLPLLLIEAGMANAFWAVSASCLLCAALSQPLREALDADRDPSRRIIASQFAGPVRQVLEDPRLFSLTVFSFCFAMLQSAMTTYLVTYLHVSVGFTLVAAGAAFSAAQAGAVVGRLAWGFVADRWQIDATRLLGWLAAMMALCSVLTAALGPQVAQPLLVALMIAFGASAIGWNGIFMAQVARMAAPGMASSATGGTIAVTFLGVVIGPVLFGAASSMPGGFATAFLLFGALAGVCAFQLLRAGSRQ